MEKRENYQYFLQIPTRWRDNDIYGHVNNAVYYAYFDTVIGHYLVTKGQLDYVNDHVVGFAIESKCQFKRAIAFPDVVEAGLRVSKVGRTSVRYEVGLFTGGHEEPAATGYFVHVFVDLANERRSTPIPDKIRTALEKILY
ncbi:MAG: acyl-CoA thioesterase [Ardenticatenaceae bacterium]